RSNWKNSTTVTNPKEDVIAKYSNVPPKDVFSVEVPSGLPSIRGIEHHIDLNPGEEFDSRTNPFEEGGNNRDSTNKVKDLLHDIRGSLTRPKTNMMKQSLQDLSMEKNGKFDS
ncbi:hypothetical protein CR513_05153, partial [Mucuna pruriens]